MTLDSMAKLFENGGPSDLSSNSSSLLHVLQRHRDILYDYNKEFKRIKENIKLKRDQAELLNYVRQDIRWVTRRLIRLLKCVAHTRRQTACLIRISS